MLMLTRVVDTVVGSREEGGEQWNGSKGGKASALTQTDAQRGALPALDEQRLTQAVR